MFDSIFWAIAFGLFLLADVIMAKYKRRTFSEVVQRLFKGWRRIILVAIMALITLHFCGVF